MGSCRKGMRGDVWGPIPGRKTDSRGESFEGSSPTLQTCSQTQKFELLFYYLLMTGLWLDPLRSDFLNVGFSRVPFQTFSALASLTLHYPAPSGFTSCGHCLLSWPCCLPWHLVQMPFLLHVHKSSLLTAAPAAVSACAHPPAQHLPGTLQKILVSSDHLMV